MLVVGRPGSGGPAGLHVGGANFPQLLDSSRQTELYLSVVSLLVFISLGELQYWL